MLTTQKRSAQTHPRLTSGGNGCRGLCGDHRPPGHTQRRLLRVPWMMLHNTLRSSTRFTSRFLENKGPRRATWSVLSSNNWAITHFLLLLPWGFLSGERIIILSCLTAYSLAQPKVNIGQSPSLISPDLIRNWGNRGFSPWRDHTAAAPPSLMAPYPELGQKHSP